MPNRSCIIFLGKFLDVISGIYLRGAFVCGIALIKQIRA
jgi:hypothetical protein